MLQISEFEAKYPWISVKPAEYNWTAPTFTTALAAGTLPTVFTIPFTDGKGLIAQHQIVEHQRPRRCAADYVSKFNPNVLVNGQDADGKVWAVPTQAYGMSLTYNRSLFTAAGLDPANPPTTWDEVRAAAKQIAEKTGVAGYAEMATANTGGWQLTTSTYANGGRMETVGDDGKVTATRQQRRHQGRPREPQGHALGGQLAGLHVRLRLGLDQPGVLVRPDRHVHRRLRPVHRDGPEQRHQARGLLRHRHPARRDADAGVLGGGTLAAVNVVTDEDQRDAAVNWIDFYYMQKLLTQEGAVADAEALKANNQPVGVPALPIFDKATYDQSQEWIKDYINVPTAQMAPFTSQIFDQQIVTEPTVHTQDLYAALDPVVQAVLTDKNADIDALLDAANQQVQAIIDAQADPYSIDRAPTPSGARSTSSHMDGERARG